MGGLLAFRVGNYDNTAEREQFRFLCEQLKAHYEDSNEFCVFAGNYNIGCELDALFIKKDAIIAIEFKNYGGKVIANENGEWTCDGTTIKGGSRKTVLQQARINHSIVKKELKVLGVEAKQIKDVPTLVVFHQPIELTNNLSATNKSWLHITDDDHFIEKLDDITCPHTDLDPLGIVNLAETLNLNSFYLTEFSNATYDNHSVKNQEIEVVKSMKNELSINKVMNNGLCKNTIELPYWLDQFIFEDLNGVYCKSNKDMVVIDWGKDDVLKYLGTYFPRSYTEAYCIVSQYLEIANPFAEKTEISLFDFGCGTGGEIIGTITAIIEKNPNLQHINILALDGNYFALRTFEKILVKYCTKSAIHITYKVIPLEIDDFYDLSVLDCVINQKFDMVISFKAICEFVTKQRFEHNNAYTHMAKFFLPRINSGGILLLADVTTYNNVSQEWLPHMMDEGLAKADCKVVAKNNGYNQAFFVTHSKKKEDISKIAWRLILN